MRVSNCSASLFYVPVKASAILARRQREAFSKIAIDLKKSAKQQNVGAQLVAQWRYETVNAMVRVLQSVK
jgi:hypothetical protein